IAILDGNRSIGKIKNRQALDAQIRRIETHAIAGLYLDALGVKAPFGNIFIAGGNLHVGSDDRVQADFVYAVSREIHSDAVLGLISESGGVYEVPGLRSIVPLGG